MLSGDGGERRQGGRGGPPGERGDREGGYRRRFGGDKEGGSGAPGEFQPQLYVPLSFTGLRSWAVVLSLLTRYCDSRGGFGRGRGAPPAAE